MAEKIIMQAPKGTSSANIEGHTYEVPKDGKITVISETHVETLKRHGFIDSFEEKSPEEIDAMIEGFENKTDLVNFIEERGGEADDDMSFKKLRRLAREAAAGQTEE